MNVLVTGGAGFIGSHVVDALLRAGHAVSVIDDLSTGLAENLAAAWESGLTDADLHVVDIASPEAAEVMGRVRPEAVLHLAAQPSVSVSMRDPRFDAHSNLTGLLNVLVAAREAGTRKVVFASSGGTIYGEPQAGDLPLREDSRRPPARSTACRRRRAANTSACSPRSTAWRTPAWPSATSTGRARTRRVRPG